MKSTTDGLKEKYLNEKSGVELAWGRCAEDLIKTLDERAAMIKTAYLSDLSEKQMEKVLREEDFVKKISVFLNDSESVVNIFKNAVLRLLDVFYSFDKENVFLKEELASERLKSAFFEEWLKSKGLYEQYLREAPVDKA